MTVGVVAAVAFIGGLVVAAGFNLTPFGYAQQAGGGAKPPQAAVQQVTDASNAFVAIAEHVTPAVVSIQMERQARPVKNPRGQQQVPPGMEDFFKQFVGKITQAVVRKSRIALEKYLVKNITRIKIGDTKEGKLCQRADALFCCLPKALLSFCVKGERMHEISADQSAFEVVKCRCLSVFVHSGFVIC